MRPLPAPTAPACLLLGAAVLRQANAAPLKVSMLTANTLLLPIWKGVLAEVWLRTPAWEARKQATSLLRQFRVYLPLCDIIQVIPSFFVSFEEDLG